MITFSSFFTIINERRYNIKYVKVVDGTKSNANGFEYVIDKINIAKMWNPKANTPKEMGGFSFSNEENILRWLIRGSVIYDVVLPSDAEMVKIIIKQHQMVYLELTTLTDKSVRF